MPTLRARALSAVCITLALAACGAPTNPDAGDARSDGARADALADANAPADAAPPTDASAPTDAPAPPEDAPAPPEDVSTPEDVPPPPEDVPAPPEDVPPPPEDVPAPPMDVVVPPMDVVLPPRDVVVPPMDATRPDATAMDARTDAATDVPRADGGCAPGTADCDRNPLNGCETSLNTLLNCGSCGTACVARPNTTASCAMGACAYTCRAGFADCDRNAGNGCEASLETPFNCGRCGNVCGGGTPLCDINRGSCVATCPAGTQRCGATCVNLQTDVDNCGVCGRACSFANAGATCTAGMCQITTCNPGFSNCDGAALNGCETNTAGSVTNCGACGRVCPVTANARPTCAAGTCGSTCNAGFGNCDGMAANGCEAALNTTSNCGACGNRCAAANAMNACVMGACAVTGCNAGFGNCDGMAATGCESPLNTTVNCGMCGNRCVIPNATATCAMGRCAIGMCATGFGNCDGNTANGCELDLRSNVNNCGACGRVCNLPNATEACSMGACIVSACRTGFGNCDRNDANGCESNLATSTANCGRCGVVCPGGLSCVMGVCR